jgi:hypothetical protein
MTHIMEYARYGFKVHNSTVSSAVFNGNIPTTWSFLNTK